MRTPEIFVAVDAVIFKEIKEVVTVLLIQRKNEPYKDCWALPGGFVNKNEDIDVAVRRELREETHIVIADLKQLKAFGKPFRDPRNHVISVAYYGVAAPTAVAKAADDAKAVAWFPVETLPELAFDHVTIIDYALSRTKL